MSIKSRIQKQTAVYWPPASVESGGRAFDKYGKPLYGTAVEKSCRWEDTAEIFVSPTGVEETSKSVVFIDNVVVGGLLMLGTLSDITDAVNPRNNAGAWEIKQLEKVPDRRATVTYTWAYL